MEAVKEQEQALGGEINILISDDKMEAYLYLSPDEKDKEFEIPQIKNLLRESGVQFGVQEERIEWAVREKIYNSRVVIAKGQTPVAGKDGWYRRLHVLRADSVGGGGRGDCALSPCNTGYRWNGCLRWDFDRQERQRFGEAPGKGIYLV